MVENYSEKLIEKSNQMYDELIETQIIPEIERDDFDELEALMWSQSSDF